MGRPLGSFATLRKGHNPPGLVDNDPPGQSNEDESSGREVAMGHRNHALFGLQDKGIRFDHDGNGVQVGPATGKICGVSITQFKITLTPNNPNFSFDNRAGITDTDGDRIIFKDLGMGRSVVPPLKQTPSTPDAEADLGEPVIGTYEAFAVSDKFIGKHAVGGKFPLAAGGCNPNPASMAASRPLGASYVEAFPISDKDKVEDEDWRQSSVK